MHRVTLNPMLLVAWMCALSTGSASAQCVPGIGSAAVGSTGTISVGFDYDIRVRVELNLSGAERSAAEDAINEWNSVRSTTKTYFEVGSGADLVIGYHPNFNAGGYSNNLNLIAADQSTISAIANNNQSHAKYVWMHEIGHFLGLNEGPPAGSVPGPTIMNQLVVPLGASPVTAFQTNPPPSLSLQPSDAAMARDCAFQARSQNSWFVDQNVTEPIPDPEGLFRQCYQPYLVTYDYTCSTATNSCVQNGPPTYTAIGPPYCV